MTIYLSFWQTWFLKTEHNFEIYVFIAFLYLEKYIVFFYVVGFYYIVLYCFVDMLDVVDHLVKHLIVKPTSAVFMPVADCG